MEKNIVITGVSSGLGFALAQLYLQKEYNVIGLSRRVPDILLQNERMTHYKINIAYFNGLASVMEDIISTVNSIDMVILNAGKLGTFGDISESSLEMMKHVTDVNMWSNKVILDFVLTHSTVRQVVAISSGAAVSGNRGWNGYSISKAALNMLIKLYAEEFSQTHFTSFAPGVIDTAMQDYLCSLPSDDRYFTIDRLKGYRNTENMPTAEVAAKNIISAISKLPDLYTSGEFVDIRKMNLS